MGYVQRTFVVSFVYVCQTPNPMQVLNFRVKASAELTSELGSCHGLGVAIVVRVTLVQ
jgi:hypothetical protein